MMQALTTAICLGAVSIVVAQGRTPVAAPARPSCPTAPPPLARVADLIRKGEVMEAKGVLDEVRKVQSLQADLIECLRLVHMGKHEDAKVLLDQPRPVGALADDLYRLVWIRIALVCMTTPRTPATQAIEELLLAGAGWIRVDVAGVKKAIGVSVNTDLLVSIVGTGRNGKVVQRDVMLAGRMKYADLSFWQGTAKLSASAKDSDKVATGSVQVQGWSNVPALAELRVDGVSQPYQLAYDSKTGIFRLKRPSGVPQRRIMFMVMRHGEDEVLYHRTLAPTDKNLSLEEVNKKVGPLVPDRIDPLKHRYDVTIFPVDKDGKQVEKSIVVVIGDGGNGE